MHKRFERRLTSIAFAAGEEDTGTSAIALPRAEQAHSVSLGNSSKPLELAIDRPVKQPKSDAKMDSPTDWDRGDFAEATSILLRTE